MKTKEELLKIYSAYLPYELKLLCDDGGFGTLNSNFGVLNKQRALGLVFRTEIIKPILYSMDMISKEVEHKGERFVPSDLLLKYTGNPEIGNWLYNSNCGDEFNINITPYLVVKKLLEWNFNVFGLDESEYIKKETLTV